MNLAWPVPLTVSRFGAMVKREVSSGFGPRSSPGGIGSTNHQGIDIPLDVGTQVYAVSRGTVIEAVPDNASAGTFVTIDHEDGGLINNILACAVIIIIGLLSTILSLPNKLRQRNRYYQYAETR